MVSSEYLPLIEICTSCGPDIIFIEMETDRHLPVGSIRCEVYDYKPKVEPGEKQ